MRKILLTFSLLFGLFLVSCSSNNPKAVAEKFLKAVNKLDFTEAKKYCDEDTQKLLSLMESFSKDEDSKVEENGDKAKVYYKAKDSEKEVSLDLKKVDGKWLVSVNKEQGAKEQGMGHDHDHDHDHDTHEGEDMDAPDELAPDDAPNALDSIPADK